MKLLVINPSADLYGANRILVNTLEFLQEQYEITLLLPGKGPLEQFIEERKLNVRVIVNTTMPTIGRMMFNAKGLVNLFKEASKTYGYLRRLKKQYGIDCVYINTQAGLPVLKLCKLIGIPALLHVHEIVDRPRIAARLINKASLRWADKIVAVSEPVKNNMLQNGNMPRHEKKVNVVLNGIADPLAKLGTTDAVHNDKVVISLIARIKPDKGIWFFLDAIAALPEHIAEKCLFNIVGSAPPQGEYLVEQLKKDMQAHKYSALINYSAFMRDVSAVQYNADILVVPSLMKDPFPTTILEAMAFGKPVIATNGGGAVQSVEHGKTGYLMNPEDVPAFVNYLILLIENGELRKTIGTEARRQYLNRFTLDVFKENFLSTFNSFAT